MNDMDARSDASQGRAPEDVTVLVVDDEADIALYLSSVLEDAGMNTVVANDGQEALARVEESEPDLISLDLVMPGHSGFKVMRELRRKKEWARIPVIIVTAHARDPQIRGDLENVLADRTLQGPSLYLEKPVTPRSYLESVCRVLGVRLDDESGEPSEERLRSEALDLLKAADASTIEEVVATLKRQKR